MLLDIQAIIRTNNRLKLAKGRVLIANPYSQEFHFFRSIVLLITHNDNGSMGVVLNKPVDINLDEMIDNFPLKDCPVNCGGPVENDRLFYLHSFPNIYGAVQINKNLYFGGDFDEIKELIDKDENYLSKIRFFIGYAGWETKQLQEEIDDASWIVSRLSNKILLRGTDDNLWKKTLLATNSTKHASWLHYPLDPNLN